MNFICIFVEGDTHPHPRTPRSDPPSCPPSKFVKSGLKAFVCLYIALYTTKEKEHVDQKLLRGGDCIIYISKHSF